VFCAYVSRHGDAFIDRALYLPKAWTDDPIRMTATHVPNGIAFATKPALAVKMISHALAVNVPFSWVAADSVYGVGDIEMALRHAGNGYVLGVSANRHFGSWRGKLARQAGAASRRSPARPRKSRRVWLPRLGAVFRRAKARKAQGSTIVRRLALGTYPRVGLIITNITRPVERVIGFYNQRGTAEQWSKKGKKAVARPPESRPAQSIIEEAPEHP
jgi:hypothetical protein